MIINDFKKNNNKNKTKHKQHNPLKDYINELSQFENNLFVNVEYNNLKSFSIADQLKKKMILHIIL